MSIDYVRVTPKLQSKLAAQWASNAGDFIRFDDEYCSLVAVADGDPIGLIVAKVRGLSEPLQLSREAFIDVIEVLPEYRRQGIGTGLVREAMEWAVENQASQIRAWSEEVRLEALMLWQKMGFTFSQVDFQRGDDKRYGFYVAKRL